MFEDIIRASWVQFGFVGLFAFSGWVVAWILYQENKKLMQKYADLLEKVLNGNSEIRHLIAELSETLNIEALLKEYFK